MGSFVINRVYDKLISLTGAAGGGVDLAAGLVSRWIPDNNTAPTDTLVDTIGGHDGVWVGTVEFFDGISGVRALVGTNHSVEIPDNAVFTGASTMSVFGWIRIANPSANKFVICHHDFGSPGARGWGLGTDTGSGDKLWVQICDDDAGTNRKLYSGNDVAFDSNEHSVGFRWNSGTLDLFVDGVKQTLTRTRDDTFTTCNDSAAIVSMNGCGGSGDYPAVGTNFDVTDRWTDFSFYSTAKSDAEFVALHARGPGG